MLLDELQEPEPVLLDGLLEHVAEMLGPVPDSQNSLGCARYVLLGPVLLLNELRNVGSVGSDVVVERSGEGVGSDVVVERSGEGVGDAFADLGVSPLKPPFNLRMVPPAK